MIGTVNSIGNIGRVQELGRVGRKGQKCGHKTNGYLKGFRLTDEKEIWYLI